MDAHLTGVHGTISTWDLACAQMSDERRDASAVVTCIEPHLDTPLCYFGGNFNGQVALFDLRVPFGAVARLDSLKAGCLSLTNSRVNPRLFSAVATNSVV